ncbi:Bro-N domain-containing protein [Pseudomonas sp. DY-1]|uniref:BRO-N domain-containing protein n=1 Tax=Pseudomonas sp. DY-1 TaxID=1755504 RepID=UPI0021153770|nr:Bro-N domain-containing protein [Pseudomonas sp. DY-1]
MCLHKHQLRAVLLNKEPWFAGSDFAQLINLSPLPERVSRNLDKDELQRAWMRNSHGDVEQAMLISESGVYAVLILDYHPENRCIRQWLTREMIPRLRERNASTPSAPIAR